MVCAPTLITELFSNLLLCLCQPLPFSWVAETLYLGFWALWHPLFSGFSLTEMVFSKDFVFPHQTVVGNLCVKIVMLSNTYRFLSCLQSQLKFSASAFDMGDLQKFLCAQKPGCWAITCLQALSCLSLDYHSYYPAWRCTIKALFHKIYPVL